MGEVSGGTRVSQIVIFFVFGGGLCFCECTLATYRFVREAITKHVKKNDPAVLLF